MPSILLHRRLHRHMELPPTMWRNWSFARFSRPWRSRCCARGMPQFVRGASLGGRVVARAGPWRRDGEWWREAGGFARDYYELALDDGGVYRIFRDLTSGRWYLDGVYD